MGITFPGYAAILPLAAILPHGVEYSNDEILPISRAGVTIALMEGDQELMSSKDVAAYLGVSDRRIRQLVESGQLKAQRVGRDYIFTLEDVKAYATTRRPVGRPPKGQ